MKYHVYAALIASTQAGPIAEAFEKDMPTKAEIQAVEDKLNSWAKQAENVTNTAKPIIKSRNQKIVKAWDHAAEQAEGDLQDFAEDLDGAVQDLEGELEQIDQYAMEDLEAAGVLEDERKLKAKIQKDLQGCQKSMLEVRSQTLSLKSIRFADDLHDNMPTKEEVAAVEATVDGWIKRAEDIDERASPSWDARTDRIKAAWKTMEKADEEVTMELIDELEKAQVEFTDDLTRAQQRFENTVTSNGAVADFEALEHQIEADLNAMSKMHSVVHRMKPANSQARAAKKLSTNLADLSEEMQHHAMKAEEWETKKATVISWVSDFEDIMAKVEPIAKQREQDIEHEFESFEGEFEELAEETLEDLQKNDRQFTATHDQANKEMFDQLKSSGAVDQFKDLGDDIDATLSHMERSMSKVRRSANLLKMHNKRAANAQSLGQFADAMRREIPSGQDVQKAEGMVTGWTQKSEAIIKKISPAAKRRDQQFEKAFNDHGKEVEGEVESAFEDWEENDQDFIYQVETASDDMHNTWEQQGIFTDAEKLGDDIEQQFGVWGQNMNRRAPVQSLTAQQSKTVSENLKNLEAELAMVLKSM